jgi:hypothetical protein
LVEILGSVYSLLVSQVPSTEMTLKEMWKNGTEILYNLSLAVARYAAYAA